MGKLNSNKSPIYQDVLIAAATFLQGETFRCFGLILACWGARLATDAKFCIRWGCFFLRPTRFLLGQAVRLHPLPPPLLQELIENCASATGALDFLSILCEAVMTAKAEHVSVVSLPLSWTWAQRLGSPAIRKWPVCFSARMYSSERPAEFWLRRKQEKDVFPYVSWKHAAVFLWIM